MHVDSIAAQNRAEVHGHSRTETSARSPMMLASEAQQKIGSIANVHKSSDSEACFEGLQQKFRGIPSVVTENTKVASDRLRDVVTLFSHVISKNIQGDWIETGVWKGGTSLLAAKILRESKKLASCPKQDRERRIFLFDSFRGLLVPSTNDTWADGNHSKKMDPPGSYAFDGGVEQVKKLFMQEHVMEDAIFVEGYFNETIPSFTAGQVAILRLDGDMYDSTMIVLENLYSKVVPGGFLIIDDYGHWPQCKKAVDDFFHCAPMLNKSDYTGRWSTVPVTC